VLQLDAGEGVHPGLRHDILRHDAQSGDGADDTQDVLANLFIKKHDVNLIAHTEITFKINSHLFQPSRFFVPAV
jgi:hypothetical protein